MKKVFLGTKEENNAMREQEFLALSPHERFLSFLKMCEEYARLYPLKEHPNRKKNNFILEKDQAKSTSN